jgi:hypothetical protein
MSSPCIFMPHQVSEDEAVSIAEFELSRRRGFPFGCFIFMLFRLLCGSEFVLVTLSLLEAEPTIFKGGTSSPGGIGGSCRCSMSGTLKSAPRMRYLRLGIVPEAYQNTGNRREEFQRSANIISCILCFNSWPGWSAATKSPGAIWQSPSPGFCPWAAPDDVSKIVPDDIADGRRLAHGTESRDADSADPGNRDENTGLRHCTPPLGCKEE